MIKVTPFTRPRADFADRYRGWKAGEMSVFASSKAAVGFRLLFEDDLADTDHISRDPQVIFVEEDPSRKIRWVHSHADDVSSEDTTSIADLYMLLRGGVTA